MSYEIRIKEAMDNETQNLEYLTSLTDQQLETKLKRVYRMMDLAAKERNEKAIELLELWRAQIIEARMRK